jgi:hypothetical protein
LVRTQRFTARAKDASVVRPCVNVTKGDIT